MKLPNFRLYDTQATFSMLLGVLSLVTLAVLAAVTFQHYNTKQGVIWHYAGGFGKFRVPLIYGLTAGTAMLGLVGGVMGFNSLGQKRNNKQGQSWIGLLLGAFSIMGAPLVLFAWIKLAMEVIK